MILVSARAIGATLLGGICLLFTRPVSASDRVSHSHVQLMLFTQPPSASDSEQISDPQFAGPASRQFAEMPSKSAGNERLFLRVVHRRTPRWMRSGIPLDTEQPFALPATSIGRCAQRGYTPSSLLGRTGEERRRLLYPLVQEAACEAGLPVGLMDAMLIQESRYNPFALSPKGAFGLGQLMPATARELGVDRFDLRGNLAGTARYLRQHLDEFGQAPLALAAYNAGPARVRERWQVPRIAETQNYVRRILTNWQMLEQVSVLPAIHPWAPRPKRHGQAPWLR